MASSRAGRMPFNNYWDNHKFAYLNPPHGDYLLVSMQLNRNGPRIVDSVVQIGACSENWVYDQFVMPHRRISNHIKFFLNVRVSYYENGMRKLVTNDTNEVIPTLSEFQGLVGFLEWLENHVPRKDGIVLMHHDRTNLMPMLLMDRLKRYNLFNRFLQTVKGFLNIGFIRDSVTGVSFRDRKLSQIAKLLKSDQVAPFRDASVRAEAIFDVIEELLFGNHDQVLAEIANGVEYPDGTKVLREMCSRIQHSLLDDKVFYLVQFYARSTRSVELSLDHMTSVLRRQHEYRCVFKGLFDFSAPVRKRAVRLRNKLVAFNIEFHHVRGCWLHFGRLGLEHLFSRIYGLRLYDMNFLLEIFDCFFDYRKLPIEVKMKRERHIRWLKMQRIQAARDELLNQG